MRTFARVLMCGLLATTLGFAACDDDAETTTDTGGGGDTTPSDTSGGDTAPADTTPADTTPADTTPADTAQDTTPADTSQDTTPADTTPPAGACSNEADMAVIGTPDDERDLSAKAAECGGTSCIAKLFESLDAFETCVTSCMLNETLPGYEYKVSDACTACFTGSVRCTAEFCGLNDPNKSCVPASFGGKGSDSADCTECRADNGCTDSFYTCSGLSPDFN